MNPDEEIVDLWENNPILASHVRSGWRDLGKALDALMDERSPWPTEDGEPA